MSAVFKLGDAAKPALVAAVYYLDNAEAAPTLFWEWVPLGRW